MLHVVAGILMNDQGEILIAYRPTHAIQGDLWEFPGGKIEPNETPYDALLRELHEEIDITVTAARPFMSVDYSYPERHVLLDVWWVDKFTGTPHGKEGQVIQWAKPEFLTTLPFPEGNKRVIKAIQSFLPS